MAGKTLKIRDKETGEVITVREKDSKPTIERQNIIGKTFNVPGAANRSAIRAAFDPNKDVAQAYGQGALNPSDVESFQDQFIRQAQFTKSPGINAALGMPASAAGLAADIATNPADVIPMLAGGLSGVRGAGSKLLGTKAGKALGRFATKERHLLPKKFQLQQLTKKVGKYLKFESRQPAEKVALAKTRSKAQQRVKLRNVRQENQYAVEVVRANKEQLAADIQQNIQGQMPSLKKSIKDFSKSVSRTYENRLDDISANVGKNIKRADVYEWGKKFLAEMADDTDLVGSQEYKNAVSFFNKFKPKEPSKGLTGFAQQVPTKPKKTSISFKELNGMRKNLINRKYDGELAKRSDVIKDAFNNSFMEFAGNYTDDFASLQSEFAPILETKKILSKWFKPNNELSSRAENLLTKYATGKQMSGDEKMVLGYIEKVSKSQGVGLDDLAQEYQKSIGAIKAVQKTGKSRELAVREAGIKRQADLATRGRKVTRFTKERKKLQQDIKDLTPQKKSSAIRWLVRTAISYWAIDTVRSGIKAVKGE